MSLHKLMGEVGDSLVALSYHPSSSDAFYNLFSNGRGNYYYDRGWSGGLPTLYFDGTVKCTGVYQTDAATYNWYRNSFNQRKVVAAPLELEIGGSNTLTRQGSVKVRITNKALFTVDGTVQIAIAEDKIKYHWKTLDSLWHVVRTMVPDEIGQDVSIPSGGSVIVTGDFTLDPSWNKNNCEVVVFVHQQGGTAVNQGISEKVLDLKPLAVEETKPVAVRVVGVSPNPFRTLTTVRFTLAHTQTVHAKVMDAAGAVVATVADGMMPAGEHAVTFNGRNLVPGVYFLNLGTADANTVTKLIVVK